MAATGASDVVFRNVNRNDLERRSRPESSHKGNLKRLKTSSVGGFQRWEKENELLWAMLEDETEWLGKLFPDIIITPELFFYALEDGVVLCRLANLIQEKAEEYGRKNKVKVPAKRFKFHKSIPKKNKQLALFKSRENVSGFLAWCRQIGISDSILFESNDVVEADECREGCREVVICLMEIARRASGSFKFTPIPKLIQLEKEIEIEEQEDAEENSIDQVDYASSDEESNNSCPSPGAHSPPTHNEGSRTSPEGGKKKSKRQQPKSELDKEVLKIIDNFNFYNIRKIKEGKYMILGKIIFVRMLNGHVLLRIGGGWDTLEHYLLTHLPKAAAENGHCTTEAAVAPSVSKTPQKSQLTKILDKVKKEQQLKKATPVSSSSRAAGSKGSKTDDGSEDDEKDITSAIRKIEFSVNQNIATRRKISRQSNEDTPQKSPNSLEESSAPSDINQNNIEGQKVGKSKSPDKAKSQGMENEVVESECNGVIGEVEFNSERKNGDELLSFEDSLVKENANDYIPSEEQSTATDNIDVVDGAVLAKLNVESPPDIIGAQPEETKQVVGEPNADIVKDHSCDNERSSEIEVSVERSEERPAEDVPPHAAVTSGIPDVTPNELPKKTDVSINDAIVSPSDPEVLPSNPDVLPTEPDVRPSDAEVPPTDLDVPSNPDIPPVITEDSEASDSTMASTTPNVPQSPQKSPSPNGDESSKKKTSKTTKEQTKTKPAGTKVPAKKDPAITTGARPKSAKPSTRPTSAASSAVKNTKRPTSAVKTSSTTTPKSGTPKPSITAKTSKPSTVASKTKAPPSGKATTTKTTSGKTSPTHLTANKKPTPKPDVKTSTSTRTTKPKATPTTQTSRPTKTAAFGSTVPVAPSKKPPNERPATAPPARSTTTQAKKKPPVQVAAKVNSWSSAARPQSAKPSSKATKDSADGVAVSKETGKLANGDRPTSPTKPLVRKTQTRTVTTTKTTRVGAGRELEVKSQTIKTTRTVTEANGKKTTKTTVKEVSPTGRKPLRMTTETTETGTGKKKATKAVADTKTGTKTTKPDAKKPGTKTGPSKSSKETGSKKAPAKAKPKSEEVSGQLKEVPKAKTVKELSNALGITKPSNEKEKETEPKDGKEEPVEKDVEARSQEETPEQPSAQIEEQSQVEELLQVEEAPPTELSPEAEEIAQSQENPETESHQDGESDIIKVEGGVDEVSQGHEGILVDMEVGEIEGQGVEGVNSEVTECVKGKGVEIDQGLVNEDAEQSESIVSDVNLVEGIENLNLEEKIAEPVEVQQTKNEAGDEVTGNEEEESGEIAEEDGDLITTFAQKIITEAHEEVVVQESPEPRDPSEGAGVNESLEDDSLDVIEVPESDVSRDENALQSTEAWPAVSVDKEPTQDVDLLGDNNNAVEEPQETESKFDPYLLPSGADTEKLVDTSGDMFDISVEGKAESLLSEDVGNTGEPPNRDSGFQETNTVDDLLG